MFMLLFAVHILLAAVVNAEPGKVIDLSSATFDDQLKTSIWFVKFYAPWCGHCKSLAPVMDQLAADQDIVQNKVNIAKVDCTKHTDICSRMNVRSYPTLKVIADKEVRDYSDGKRDLDRLKTYVLSGYKTDTKEALLSKDEYEAKLKKDEAERIELAKNSQVKVITMENFEDLILNNEKAVWFLKFYAPWCGHCKRLAPIWQDLSIKLKDKQSNVQVGQVDCTVHRRICSRFGVTGYPSLYFVKDKLVYRYKKSRSVKDLVDFALTDYKQEASMGPIPDESFFSSTVDNIMMWCQNHPVLAALIGIALLALTVALLVALLDYCMGDEDIVAQTDSNASKKKMVDGEDKAE